MAQAARVCVIQPIVPSYRVPFFDRLARQPGIDLEVWATKGWGGLSLDAVPLPDHVPFRAVARHTLGPFVLQPAQVAAARSGQFDVLVLGWNSRYLTLWPALQAAKQRGLATVLWGHGFSKHESAARRGLRNWLLRRADGCILYNHAAADRLAAEGYPRERLFVALNALDQAPIRAAREQWQGRPDELDQFRRAHGLHEKEAVLFISRLERDKRVDLLLDAFAVVRRNRPRAKLVLIGKGADEERLRAYAHQVGVASDTLFVGPLFDEMRIAPWCLSATVFAYPVAVGLSILHAFGYGLPVVTSDDIPAHNPEIESMQNGRNGLLYRDGNPHDFAAKLLMFLDEPARARQAATEAIATVDADGFSIERMVRGFATAVREIHGRRVAFGTRPCTQGTPYA